MYQHAAQFLDEQGEHGTADREREPADREARDAEPDPASQRQAVKSHHLIRRSVPRVRPVRLNPYPQVSVLPDVRHGCHSPVRSGQSVRKL